MPLSEEAKAAMRERQRDRMADPAYRAAHNAREAARRRGEPLPPSRRGSVWQGGGGKLAKRLEVEMPASLNVADITVLTPSNDPYRMDNAAGHEMGKWIAEHLDLVMPGGRIHPRGLHYRLASRGDLLLPRGKRYTNSTSCWTWLADAVAAARWLGYVPWNRITDERSDPPTIMVPDDTKKREGTPQWMKGSMVPFLSHFEQYTPKLGLDYVNLPQPYRLIIAGEKSSLREELLPVAELVEAELFLLTGEMGNQLIHGICERAAIDGRPAVILYFSDFDPSGNQMPVSICRKLQAFRDTLYPDLDIEMHHVALTLDQVNEFDLPSIPMKVGEKRAVDWRAKFGREQTEIDALLAVHPGELTRIAEEAIAPFFDFDAADRLQDAVDKWEREAAVALEGNDDYQKALAALKAS